MKKTTVLCMNVVLTLAIIIPSNAFSTSELALQPTISPPQISLYNLPDETYLLSDGTGYVDVTINSKKIIKILVQTPSNENIWLTPTPQNNIFFNRIWLTQGIGKYEISVMENLHENLYSYLKSVTVHNEAILDKYLLPSKEIESDSPEIIALAQSITQDGSTTSEKAICIYNWVSTNIVYDLPKYFRMGKNDFSMSFGALSTLLTRKGVCYDYSSLYAALGRASGIKVKVVTGNYHNRDRVLYHSWNEVYISESQQWISLDTSMAFIYKKSFYDTLDTVNVYEKNQEF